MRSLALAVVGGGPAGLFLARLVGLRDPSAKVVVHERNAPDATFGFGVVFSDRTMSAFERADPETSRRLRDASVRWTDMEIRHAGRSIRYGGYGFTAISRRTLLRILQEQAAAVGAELRFEQSVTYEEARRGADVVAVADGANSAVRRRYAERFGTHVETAESKYIWFGTSTPFEQVTFPFVNTRYGSFAAHAYPYEPGTSTFIVETDTATWEAAGMADSTRTAGGPGQSDMHSKALLEDVFKQHLDGRPLLVNNSRWAAFQVVRNSHWSHADMVLLGDAAHTAHFSVGSGTKMAMEDAIALADALEDATRPGDAFRSYEEQRRAPVARTQDWARPSMRWWATFGTRLHREPEQFGFHFLTRTGAISHRGLRRRHASRIDEVESWFATRAHRSPTPSSTHGSALGRSALSVPMTLGGEVLAGRVAAVVSAAEGREQQRAVAAFAAAGSGLTAVDWSPDSLDRAGAWRETVQRAREDGCVVLASVRPDDDDGIAAASAAGIPLVEFRLPARSDDGVGDGLRRRFATLAPEQSAVAGLRCPAEDAWSDAGDRFLRWCAELARCGVHAFRLRAAPGPLSAGTADPSVERAWEHALEYADLIKERCRLPVLLDGPAGWALSVPGASPDDGWGPRLHTAVLSGRVDVVIGWPLTSPR